MPIKYEYAPDLHEIAVEVSKLLFPHIKIDRIKCFRSHGSTSKNTIARCHSMSKIMQLSLGIQAFYPIEFISEQFDKMSKEEQVKTIIHELMHIPKSFGGGFRHHDYVCEKNVSTNYKKYISKKKKDEIEENQTKLW